MFVKYNGVLRAAVSPDKPVFTKSVEICRGNRYPSTIASLSAAVIKLGKIERAGVVYRAPGGALPTSFWKRNPDGAHSQSRSSTTDDPTL